jgi:hypothetical protein
MNPTLQTEPQEATQVLQKLRDEHRILKQRVAELEHNVSMTPQEQLECARLKKLKLATKDQIFQLEHQLK